MDYNEYLNSYEWEKRRQQTLKLWGDRCTLCYGSENLQVHHRTYIRLGDELQTDLIVLCDDCHKRHHEILSLNDKMRLFWQDVQRAMSNG